MREPNACLGRPVSLGPQVCLKLSKHKRLKQMSPCPPWFLCHSPCSVMRMEMAVATVYYCTESLLCLYLPGLGNNAERNLVEDSPRLPPWELVRKHGLVTPPCSCTTILCPLLPLPAWASLSDVVATRSAFMSACLMFMRLPFIHCQRFRGHGILEAPQGASEPQTTSF